MLGDSSLPDQVDLVPHQDDGPVSAGLHSQLPHGVHGVVVGARVRDGEDDDVGIHGDVLALHIWMLGKRRKRW